MNKPQGPIVYCDGHGFWESHDIKCPMVLQLDSEMHPCECPWCGIVPIYNIEGYVAA